MQIENNSEGTNSAASNIRQPARDLVRFARLEADKHKKNVMDSLPSLHSVLESSRDVGICSTQQKMEQVSREDQLMSGALHSISEQLSSPLAEALRQSWETARNQAGNNLSSVELDHMLKQTNTLLIKIREQLLLKSKYGADFSPVTRTIIKQMQELRIRAEEKFVTFLEGTSSANIDLQGLEENLQDLSRKLAQKYADKFFHQEFMDLLKNANISLTDLPEELQNILRSLHRRIPLQDALKNTLQDVPATVFNRALDDKTTIIGKLENYFYKGITEDIMVNLLKSFAEARGKAKEKIINQEGKIYKDKDKDISNDYWSKFITNGPCDSVYGTLLELKSNDFSFKNALEIDDGKIVCLDVRNISKHTYLSDAMGYLCELVLPELQKTFADFTLNKIMDHWVHNHDALLTMALYANEESFYQTFEQGEDGFYAYLGSSKWLVSAHFSHRFRGRKPSEVSVSGLNITYHYA